MSIEANGTRKIEDAVVELCRAVAETRDSGGTSLVAYAILGLTIHNGISEDDATLRASDLIMRAVAAMLMRAASIPDTDETPDHS